MIRTFFNHNLLICFKLRHYFVCDYVFLILQDIPLFQLFVGEAVFDCVTKHLEILYSRTSIKRPHSIERPDVEVPKYLVYIIKDKTSIERPPLLSGRGHLRVFPSSVFFNNYNLLLTVSQCFQTQFSPQLNG